MVEVRTATSRRSSRPSGESRVGELMAGLRKMPLFRQLAPMESGVGWPIPVRHRIGWDGTTKVYVRLPLFGFRREHGPDANSTVLYPPFAAITLDWANGRPMEYADLRYTRPWPMLGRPGPVGTFPHDAVRGSIAEYSTRRSRLLVLYDLLLDGLATGQPFAGVVEDEFRTLLRVMVEPGLEPYYRALGSSFYAAFLGPGSSAADMKSASGALG